MLENIKHTHTKFTHGRRMTIIVELRIIVMDEDHLLISLCLVQSASSSDDDFLTSISSLVSLVSPTDRSSFSYLSLREFNGEERTRNESSNRRVFWAKQQRQNSDRNGN